MEGWCALIAFTISWLIAQVSKVVVGLVSDAKKGEKMGVGSAVRHFTKSGGMPSGHTASFTAVTTYLGLTVGWGSGLFALAACSLMVIIYDATHVRYAVGEQGKALNQLLAESGRPVVPIVEGHTVPQVAVGLVLGVIVAWIVFVLTEGIVV